MARYWINLKNGRRVLVSGQIDLGEMRRQAAYEDVLTVTCEYSYDNDDVSQKGELRIPSEDIKSIGQ
jgi:hypothetical protein